MILFIGQVGSDFAEREAFQEIDYRRMFGPMAKWVAQIDRAERVPEFMSPRLPPGGIGPAGAGGARAARGHAHRHRHGRRRPRYQACRRIPPRTDVRALRALLAGSRAPAAGRRRRRAGTQSACDDIRRFAEANALPVGCAFRYQDHFDNAHPNYAGDIGIGMNPKLAQRVRDADLLLVVGARLGEMTTGGYTLVESPVPKQKLVHVHAGAEELGRVYQRRAADQCRHAASSRPRGDAPRSTAALGGVARNRRAPTTRPGTHAASPRARSDLAT